MDINAAMIGLKVKVLDIEKSIKWCGSHHQFSSMKGNDYRIEDIRLGEKMIQLGGVWFHPNDLAICEIIGTVIEPVTFDINNLNI